MDYTLHIKKMLLEHKERILDTNKNKSAIALVEILDDEINNFSFKDKKDISYIIDIFDLLIKLLNNNEYLQAELSDKFTSIHNNIQVLLHSKSKNCKDDEKDRYNKLQKIINKMEETMLIIYNNNPVEYDPNKEEFIDYVIFKLKYINYFNAVCEKYPYIVNSLDKKGTPLIERVLDKYLEALDLYLSKENLGPIDDLIYYDKVINIIIKSKKNKTNEYTKKIMLKKIEEYTKNKKLTSSKLKEKLSFFINNLIDTIIGMENELDIDFLSYKYEINTKFNQAQNLEAKNIYIKFCDLKENSPRKIYTFDGYGAKEIDDGISIEYKDGIFDLGVHIADPTSYIDFNSILMDEAKRRTTSRYIGDYCIPLYPFILSGDLMSLNEGKPRYSIGYYFKIDEKTGDLIDFKIKHEIIKVEKNLTYNYFNSCLEYGNDDEDFLNTLIQLSNVSEILKKVYNEEQIYKEFHSDNSQTLSQSVIESAMIYTNHQVAKYFDEHELPFIYRCHEINEEELKKLTLLQERLQQKGNMQLVKNIETIKHMYPRAHYTVNNIGHAGLGTKYYSHSTSPLRRLADNFSNLCIKRFYLNDYTKDDLKRITEILDEIAETINSKRASGDDFDIQYAKLKLNKK